MSVKLRQPELFPAGDDTPLFSGVAMDADAPEVPTVEQVRRLVQALIRPGPFHDGGSFGCWWCAQTFMGTAEELARTEHRPGCPYTQALHFLEASS